MRHRVYKKRPCRVCRHWYRPDPRLGDRQRTCGCDECKQEWNRRLCANRRHREKDYDRERRLRDRLQAVGPEGKGRAPEQALNLEAVRQSIPLELFVLIDEVARVTREWVRHTIPVQLVVTPGKSHRLIDFRPRHSIAAAGPPE